jgi:transketolase
MPQAEDWAGLARRARARLLKMHFEAKIGHLGGNLSCLDALLVLYARHLRPQDAFVLSKGHSAGALYVALWAAGRLDEALLPTFHQDGTRLAGHPMAGWHPDILFSTGSLGHGLSQAAGLALADRLQGRDRRVACLLSDGEWQEGSSWEALIFAAHHKLDRLCALVDLNGLQGFGSTAEVASLADLEARLRGFDVDLQSLDGHDPAALEAALARPSDGRPRVLLLRTVKGKGVSFMEGRLEWHYLPLDAAQYARALAEVGA